MTCLPPPPHRVPARLPAHPSAQVGADYQDKKSRERFGDEWQASDNAAPTVGARGGATTVWLTRGGCQMPQPA